MSPERWRRLHDVVDAALGRPAEQRQRFVDDECADDPDLHAEARRLVEGAERVDTFLEPPDTPCVRRTFAEITAGEPIGRRVGAYELTHVLGTGGMGTVYGAVRADDTFERQVAIKLINRGMDSEHVLRRFQRERRLLARLDHPNIARLLDGGTTEDGRPFIVMEYVAGVPIDTYCHDNDLDVAQRVDLFVRVCSAVQYAHRNLIVHRDLKPSNILVGGDGEPKLLDFGISKLLEDNWLTEPTVTGARVMTPQYASPEQIRGEPVTTSSDVYSLGVVLYELLTGVQPYRLTDLPGYERERIICERDPTAPSTAVHREPELRRRLRGDLDTIILKTLGKEPERRYATAQELADDLTRHRGGMPVRARRDTAVYRATKFVRRNKLGVAAVAGIILALTAGTIFAAVGFHQARDGEDAALHSRNQAQDVTQFLQEMLVGANPYTMGSDVTVYELLENAAGRIEDDYAHQPELQAAVQYAVAETYAGMWEWGKVIRHAEGAVINYQRLHGTQHTAVADCMNLLGRAYTFAGDARAVNVQRDALAIRRRLAPEGDRSIAVAKGLLGFALWRAAWRPDYEEAERYYMEALERLQQLDATPSRDHARFCYGLGSMYHRQGRLDEAEQRFREAVEIYRLHEGRNDRYMVMCLQSYANLLQNQRRFDEALTLLEEVHAAAPQDFAVQARDQVLWRIGTLRLLAGDHEGGRRAFHEVLAAECDRLVNRRDVGDRLRYSESPLEPDLYVELARELYPVRVPGSYETAIRLRSLARLLQGDTYLEHAAELFELCMSAWPSCPDEPHIVATMTELIHLYDKLGDTENADAWRARRPTTWIDLDD